MKDKLEDFKNQVKGFGDTDQDFEDKFCTQVLVKQANPPMPVTASLKKAESLALGQIALFRSILLLFFITLEPRVK